MDETLEYPLRHGRLVLHFVDENKLYVHLEMDGRLEMADFREFIRLKAIYAGFHVFASPDKDVPQSVYRLMQKFGFRCLHSNVWYIDRC